MNGYDGFIAAYETGKGRVIIRGEAKIEEDANGRESIIVSSIPYQVNKAEMIRKTAELVEERRIEGISDIRDESNRQGLRIVYELKRDAVANVVLNKLYQYTALQSSFSVNNVALVKGRPKTLNLKEIIAAFVEHRHEVVVRRAEFELKEAEKRAHILEGLLIALDHLDEVIALIRASQTPDEARNGLMQEFGFTEVQAKAILDMRLQRLTGLERGKIKEEYEELMKQIEYLKSLLADEGLRMELIKNELIEIRDKYGDEPKTDIIYSAKDFRIEDTIANESMVVSISHLGYIKRTSLVEYRVQHRGGRGAKGSEVRDEDFVEHLFVATAHNYILFFTEKGRCFWLRVFEIPEGTKSSKGRAMQNLINIEPDDKVKAYINVHSLSDEEYINNNYIILCTKKGIIKKTSLEAYSRPRVNGINAITIRENDELIEARLTNGSSEIILATKEGRAIRFNENTVRPMGRNASGVKGITLSEPDNEVIGMICLEDDKYDILVVSSNGYGKRSKVDDYRITGRGGKGVKTINITEKTGKLIAVKNVINENHLMIISRAGLLIRLPVSSLPVIGRATQGVRVINIKEGDSIAAVTKVDQEEDEDVNEENTVNDELIDELTDENSDII